MVFQPPQRFALLVGIQQSFRVLPLGSVGVTEASLELMVRLCGELFAAGLIIAAPIAVLCFIVTMALGFLSRSVQQLNVFQESFTLRVVVGGAGVVLFPAAVAGALALRIGTDAARRGRLLSGHVMSDEAGEKKFELSDKRRQQLGAEGNIPKSHDVSTTTILAVGLGMLTCGGGMLIDVPARDDAQLVPAGRAIRPLRSRRETVGTVFSDGLWHLARAFLSARSRWRYSSRRSRRSASISPTTRSSLKFEKLNPLDGSAKYFLAQQPHPDGAEPGQAGRDRRRFAYLALKDIQSSAVFERPVNLDELGEVYVDIAWSLGWRIVLVARRRWRRPILAGSAGNSTHDNRMTFEEVKEERRSQEASPEVIKKRRLMAARSRCAACSRT